MKHETIGAKLREARESLQMSQACMCRHSGLTRSRLCQLEKGRRLPTEAEWERLQEHLLLGAYPRRVDLPGPLTRWGAGLPKLTTPIRGFPARAAAAKQTFGTLAERAIWEVDSRADEAICQKFLEQARLDSGDEALLWLRLLAEGATPCCFSPQKAGYRTFSIIDSQSRAVIGDMRLPCLEVIDDCQACLFFPQITLLAGTRTYRVDALVCVRSPKKRLWINLEVDGSGHISDFDHRREQHLRLPTVRLTQPQLAAPALTSCLLTRIDTLVASRQAS